LQGRGNEVGGGEWRLELGGKGRTREGRVRKEVADESGWVRRRKQIMQGGDRMTRDVGRPGHKRGGGGGVGLER